MNTLKLVQQEEKKYKVIKIGSKCFADEIISRSQQNILKNYVYVDACIVIA